MPLEISNSDFHDLGVASIRIEDSIKRYRGRDALFDRYLSEAFSSLRAAVRRARQLAEYEAGLTAVVGGEISCVASEQTDA